MLQKQLNRLRRKARVRSQISGTKECPRLSIFRSTNHIYAQIINDDDSMTLVSSSDLKINKGAWVERAKEVGVEIAKLAKAKKISSVVFDRGWFQYHGRVQALAEGAREWGLKF